MKVKFAFSLLALLMLLAACPSCSPGDTEDSVVILSPDQLTEVMVCLLEDGTPAYRIIRSGSVIIDTSTLGFKLLDEDDIAGNFRIASISNDSSDLTWQLPWGDKIDVRDHHNQAIVTLREKNGKRRKMELIFRVYNDGVGFRYRFPEQPRLNELKILEENTEFRLADDHLAWWIPGDWDSYEHLYNHTRVTEIDARSLPEPGINQSHIPENAVHTPLTMETDEGICIAIHEANLTDYAPMTLIVDASHPGFRAGLVDSERMGYAVQREVPFDTPWRTIQIAASPGELLGSDLILNLNEPSVLKNTDWITPMKYNGIWWEMHLGISGWDMEGGRHGATTENAKRYIDFAAENGLGGTLVEGWNTGWDRWTGIPDREGVFDFVTPYADYDLEEVARYAREKGVELIMHHETSAAPRTYEAQLDTAYSLMRSLGIRNAKLGYVGKIIPDGEHHHGQWMVNHYRTVLEKAAEYGIAINIHEPIKQTGLRRTYPNLVSGEGLRGQEFNAWAADGGNPPDHLTIVPFTRMLAGPIDYTPGIFNIMLEPYRKNNRVNTTLAHQLALYVIISSPIQMAADLPESYLGNPAFQFIRDVGVDWEETIVAQASIGDHLTIARKERETGEWFVGSITDEHAREVLLSLDFLDPERSYEATIYRDGADADWKARPQSIAIEHVHVNNTTELSVKLAPGGGAAIRIAPSQQDGEQ